MTSWEKTLWIQKSEEESKISLAFVCCLYGAIGNTVVVVVVHAMEDHSKWLTDYLRQTHNMNAGQIVTLHHTYSHHRCQTHFQDGCCHWKTSFSKFISNWGGKRKFVLWWKSPSEDYHFQYLRRSCPSVDNLLCGFINYSWQLHWKDFVQAGTWKPNGTRVSWLQDSCSSNFQSSIALEPSNSYR